MHNYYGVGGAYRIAAAVSNGGSSGARGYTPPPLLLLVNIPSDVAIEYSPMHRIV